MEGGREQGTKFRKGSWILAWRALCSFLSHPLPPYALSFLRSPSSLRRGRSVDGSQRLERRGGTGWRKRGSRKGRTERERKEEGRKDRAPPLPPPCDAGGRSDEGDATEQQSRFPVIELLPSFDFVPSTSEASEQSWLGLAVCVCVCVRCSPTEEERPSDIKIAAAQEAPSFFLPLWQLREKEAFFLPSSVGHSFLPLLPTSPRRIILLLHS